MNYFETISFFDRILECLLKVEKRSSHDGLKEDLERARYWLTEAMLKMNKYDAAEIRSAVEQLIKETLEVVHK